MEPPTGGTPLVIPPQIAMMFGGYRIDMRSYLVDTAQIAIAFGEYRKDMRSYLVDTAQIAIAFGEYRKERGIHPTAILFSVLEGAR